MCHKVESVSRSRPNPPPAHTYRAVCLCTQPKNFVPQSENPFPCFLCFNILRTSNLHGSTSTFIKIQFDVLGLFLSDLMVETRESVGNPRSKIWVESSRYLSRWVLGDPSLILQRWEFWTMVDPGNRFRILCLAGEGAGCQGGIAGRPLARIYGVLLK